MLSLMNYHREVSSEAQISEKIQVLQPPPSSAHCVPPTESHSGFTHDLLGRVQPMSIAQRRAIYKHIRYMCVYIYIEREREIHMLYIYIYIYMYRERESVVYTTNYYNII